MNPGAEPLFDQCIGHLETSLKIVEELEGVLEELGGRRAPIPVEFAEPRYAAAA